MKAKWSARLGHRVGEREPLGQCFAVNVSQQAASAMTATFSRAKNLLKLWFMLSDDFVSRDIIPWRWPCAI